ncbi:MAG: hypothetical protein GY830_05660 [Bacteroidetes bacterium]|nr:hypothetical protein [Bacteroidota bacterium]
MFKKVYINILFLSLSLFINCNKKKNEPQINGANQIQTQMQVINKDYNNKKYQDEICIILIQGLKIDKNSPDYIEDLKAKLEGKFTKAKIITKINPKCKEDSIEKQSQKIFNEIQSYKNEKIVLIGHSQGANKAALILKKAEKHDFKNISMIGIGGPIEGAEALFNMKEKLQNLNKPENSQILKDFIKDIFKGLDDDSIDILMESFLNIFVRFIDISNEEGILDLKKQSPHIKEIENYLSKTNKNVLLVGTKSKFYDFIMNYLKHLKPKMDENEKIELKNKYEKIELKNKYEKKIDSLFNKFIIGSKIEEENDLLIKISSQCAYDINNKNIVRKEFNNITHFEQPKSSEIIDYIVNFITKEN